MAIEVRHAPGIADYMLCGVACDAYESGDIESPFTVALPGQMVTCKECRGVIDRVLFNFKTYRYNPQRTEN